MRKAPELERLIARTGKPGYAQSDGSFSEDEFKAMRFPSATAAREFCKKHEIRNAEMILRVDRDPHLDMRLKLL